MLKERGTDVQNPKAVQNNIFLERLADETILYDKANHKAHSLNQTVALVWESADGQRSVDEIATILHRSLGVPEDRTIVLLALEELQTAGLLEMWEEIMDAPQQASRRQVARRLAVAGISAALVPFVATVLAPTPAMASSGGVTAQQSQTDLNDVEADVNGSMNKFDSNPTAQTDLANAETNYADGDYSAEVSDLDDVLKALGLPPL
jgi:hypothetical protein